MSAGDASVSRSTIDLEGKSGKKMMEDPPANVPENKIFINKLPPSSTISSSICMLRMSTSESVLPLEENFESIRAPEGTSLSSEDGDELNEAGNGVQKVMHKFNLWGGKSVPLFYPADEVDGDQLKYWKEPPKVALEMDPFCRTSAYGCEKEPHSGEAYLVYKSK